MSSFLPTSNGWLQIIFFILVLASSIRPLGAYIARVYKGKELWLSKVFGPIERAFYKLAGILPEQEMTWQQYAIAVLSFGMGSFILLYTLLRCQGFLPLNPQHLPGLPSDLSFNIAASFITNTNWQSYAGENTLSYFSQMVGLVVQNFLSAAVGMAVLVAFIRGLSHKKTETLGHFWVDLLRGVLYILLPLSLIWALLLGGQGVIQNFNAPIQVPLIESITVQDATKPNTPPQVIKQQKLPMGPVASQVAIKQLGTNGGGYFTANSAHPFENPTALSNFFEMLAILLIPMALCYTFGIMIRDRRQGWAVFITMATLFIPLMLLSVVLEQGGNPRFDSLHIDQEINTTQGHEQPGGNMEGKELRLGIVNSALWSAATTGTANGSTNASLDSFTPLGGGIPLLLMQFGEVIYGGVGSGLYGMLMFVIIAVFIAGLMVGRTPEYLGKKIQTYEMKMAAIAILIPPFFVLILTAIAVLMDAGKAGALNPGAQGFSEILYAFTSAANNNGSAFAGLSANTPFYNTLTGIAMLFGRYWVMIPILAIAGSFASRKSLPHSAGTLPTHTPLFIAFLIATIYIVGVLIYMTTLILGPIVEHLILISSAISSASTGGV